MNVDFIYPIGSIYMSVNPTNPGTLFGGTWTAISQGRCLVGVGKPTQNNNTNLGTLRPDELNWYFNVGEAGGEFLHQLSVPEIPSHKHDQVVLGSQYFLTAWNNNQGSVKGFDIGSDFKDNLTPYGSGVQNSFDTQYTGGGQPHNNIQPYYAVYMWKRTA